MTIEIERGRILYISLHARRAGGESVFVSHTLHGALSQGRRVNLAAQADESTCAKDCVLCMFFVLCSPAAHSPRPILSPQPSHRAHASHGRRRRDRTSPEMRLPWNESLSQVLLAGFASQRVHAVESSFEELLYRRLAS